MVNQQVCDWDGQHLKQASFISSSLRGSVKFQRQQDNFVETVLNIYENQFFEKSYNELLQRLMNSNQ